MSAKGTPRYTGKQLAALCRRMRQDYAQHQQRLHVRRLLLDRLPESAPNNATGTHVPPPFDKSALVIRALGGDPEDAVQYYAARIGGNQPTVAVMPVSLDGKGVTATVDRTAAAQERLLMSMLEAAGGRQAQRMCARSGAWGRVGYLLTLPREAGWGLPDRQYYDEATDDELAALREAGSVSPEPDSAGRPVEAGTTWLERRRKAARERAASAKSLFTLEAFPPDMCILLDDADGGSRGLVTMQVARTDCGPGSELARSYARRQGVDGPDVDLAQFGMYWDDRGRRIVGGIVKGGEPQSQTGDYWTLSIFLDRDEVYYMLAASPAAEDGTVVWWDRHGAGRCPLVAVPALRSDSRRPGSEYSSPLESVFALAPILNQMTTVLSNVAAYNAFARWVIETGDGNLIRDPKTGDPVEVGHEIPPGLDPTEAQVVPGKVRQLVIDADLLLKLLEYVTERMDKAKPSGAATGDASGAAPAWTVRQLIEQVNENLKEPVDNMAAALKEVLLLWIGWMRELDVPLFQFAAPGKRASQREVRGLIEFDPQDLVESITVTIDSNSASDRVVLAQAGIERYQAGLIDLERLAEEYFREDDVEDYLLRHDVALVTDRVLLGDTTKLMPGSLLADVADAVRGQVTYDMLRYPDFAIASSLQMAQQARQQAAQQQQQALPPGSPGQGDGGNMAGAQGVREAGVGMGLTQPGTPEMGAPNVGPRVPVPV